MSRVVIISGKQGSGKTKLINQICQIFEKKPRVISISKLENLDANFKPEKEILVFKEVYSLAELAIIHNIKKNCPPVGILIETQRIFNEPEKSSKEFTKMFNLIEL